MGSSLLISIKAMSKADANWKKKGSRSIVLTVFKP
jgi:hypothetical protein